MRRRLAVLALALALSACAPRPVLDARGADPTLTPERAAADVQGSVGRTVQWGGLVVLGVNRADATQFEVLAFPLDREGRPRTDQLPVGRFLALREGYVETAVYAAGRLLTVAGPFTGTQMGRVGEMEYTYAVVNAEQLYLWPADEGRVAPRVQFGIGVGF